MHQGTNRVIYVYVYVCICMCMYMCIYGCVYIHIYIYIYIYVHTHTYTLSVKTGRGVLAHAHTLWYNTTPCITLLIWGFDYNFTNYDFSTTLAFFVACIVSSFLFSNMYIARGVKFRNYYYYYYYYYYIILKVRLPFQFIVGELVATSPYRLRHSIPQWSRDST